MAIRFYEHNVIKGDRVVRTICRYLDKCFIRTTTSFNYLNALVTLGYDFKVALSGDYDTTFDSKEVSIDSSDIPDDVYDDIFRLCPTTKFDFVVRWKVFDYHCYGVPMGDDDYDSDYYGTVDFQTLSAAWDYYKKHKDSCNRPHCTLVHF